MTSTVTTASRPLAAGCRGPRRSSAPVLLSLNGPRRRRTASCSALASPEKQIRTASKLPLPPPPEKPQTEEEEEEERATDYNYNYNEVAAALESIYKLSPAVVVEDEEESRVGSRSTVIVRSRRRGRRMDLGKRVELSASKAAAPPDEEREFEDALVREHAVSMNMGRLDWKRMKIPPVLGAAQSRRLFKAMQTMKAILRARETLRGELRREPTDAELAAASSMSTVTQMRRRLHVGLAARNKLIKHNLRLVLYAMNRYYPDMASSNDERFDDLCQAGAGGLITAIDRFEPKRGFRISTYALFWIRHAVVRAMALSSFIHFPFAMESERQEIGKAREELAFELGRTPTEAEVIKRVGISPARYRDVQRMTRPVYSLHSRNRVTQEELIDQITDADGIGADAGKQNNMRLRLAIDDLLDSLKPKESLVIRQRFGLDGRKRTLSEVAGNLNISREMVRKYELKALMKLKHPTRVDYLRSSWRSYMGAE